MKKLTAIVICILMIATCAGAWAMSFFKSSKAKKDYSNYVYYGDYYAEREIYIDAVKCYQMALSIKPNDFDLAMKIVDMYRLMGDDDGYINANRTAQCINPNNPVTYVNIVKYYYEHNSFNKAIEEVNLAKKVIPANEEIIKIDELISTLFKNHILKVDQTGDWRFTSKGTFFSAMEGEKWGLYNDNGDCIIPCQYDYIGMYDSITELIPCSKDGNYYYIDIENHKKSVPDVKYEFLGSFGNGFAPAKKEGKYGYINSSYDEINFEYDFSGSFANGIAAVKKNKTWQLINTDFDIISKESYDDIILDSYGFCSKYDSIVVKKGDKYMLIDLNAKQIGDSYDDIRPAATVSDYCAVKKDGKWGFMDHSGKIVIEPQFEDAKSFCMGYAPVNVDGAWGYIGTSGNILVEPTFLDASELAWNGFARVKTADSSSWSMIEFLRFEN